MKNIDRSLALLGAALFLVGLSFLVRAQVAVAVLCGTGAALAILSVTQIRKKG